MEALFTPAEVKQISGDIAKGVGRLLRQEHRLIDGTWWLFTLGKAMRPLTADEVQWHTERKHAPFVEGGMTTDDPRWFDDPK